MKIKFKSIYLIPLAIFSFMSFISYIAFIRPSKISQLVSNKYYEAEIKYQKVINEKKNAINLKDRIEIKSLSEGLKIKFPPHFNTSSTTGILELIYYPDEKWDIKMKFSKEKELFIPQGKLKTGLYNVILKWTYKNKKYLIEEKILWKT